MSKVDVILREVRKLSTKERTKLIEKILKQVKQNQKVKENNEWEILTAKEFFAGYSKNDSVYDKL